MKSPARSALAARFAFAGALVTAMVSGCAGAAAPTASPTLVAATTPSPTEPPTPSRTAAPSGPTPIPYPGPSAPPGTLTLQISAQNLSFDTSALSAPTNTPFVISFDNKDTSVGCGAIGCAHNVAIRLGSTILFNPLPAIVGPAHAEYYIPEGLAAGSYTFFCVVHSTMHGDLTIT